jgi:hypothetical protein
LEHENKKKCTNVSISGKMLIFLNCVKKAERIVLKDECLKLAKENDSLTTQLKKCMDNEMKKLDAGAEANLKQQLSIAVQVYD